MQLLYSVPVYTTHSVEMGEHGGCHFVHSYKSGYESRLTSKMKTMVLNFGWELPDHAPFFGFCSQIVTNRFK